MNRSLPFLFVNLALVPHVPDPVILPMPGSPPAEGEADPAKPSGS